MSKAKWCADCKFGVFPGVAVMRCAKGHKPRFYMPKDGYPYADEYGWKRRCGDFETGDQVKKIKIKFP